MKRKTTFVLLPFMLIFLSFFCLGQLVQANESSCVKCHTNEQTLKTLHKPVKSASSEEEG